MKKTALILLALLTACASPATPSAPDLVGVQYSFSTQAWVPDLYSCAAETGVALSTQARTADFFDQSAQLWIRLGEPDEIAGVAYEIGEDEIVLVANRENLIHTLTPTDIRAIFGGEVLNWEELGGEDIPIQVWTFTPGEESRQIFDAIVMFQQPVSSRARLAVDTGSLLAGIVSDPGAIGFLLRSLVSAVVQVISIKDLPISTKIQVLAIPFGTDQNTSKLIACLQNR